MATDPTTRFTKTVDDYIKYRPGYPLKVLKLLQEQAGLSQTHIIADIGSGTGKLTELFLQNGNEVYGVEPNEAMRHAGEKLLAHYPNFHSVAGIAEATMLPKNFCDFVLAGTAFHWFEPVQTKIEFQRILKPKGVVVIVFNLREKALTPFMRGYEDLLLKYGTDYQEVASDHFAEEKISEFFLPHQVNIAYFDNAQSFDFVGVKGRLDSTSYAPRADDAKYPEMIAYLRDIFDRYQVDERVEFIYKTKVYWGVI